MSKEILINQLFAGKYLDEGENIGHEVINLFKDDDGRNNLYITPSGFVSGHDIKYVFFVRNTSKRTTVEVISMAKGIQVIPIEDNKYIRYAGVSLDRIFNGNLYHGQSDISKQHVTYRAENVYIPRKPIYITIDNCFSSEDYVLRLDTSKQVIIPQGMRTYFSETDDAIAYSQLESIIMNEGLWDDNSTEKLYPDGGVYNEPPSFLEVIRKEDDENVFSNLLSYFFEYNRSSFRKFSMDVLSILDMSTAFEIYRETKYRTDIWIESENDIIVIENKINSGINGIKDDSSQLNNYYNEAEREAQENNKRTHYFIFAPNYAKLDISKFGMQDVYKVIYYSDIYEFFIKESEAYIADRAFPDFIRGLKRHTQSLPELQHNIMRSRLLRKINLLQQYQFNQNEEPTIADKKIDRVSIYDIADEIERIVLASDDAIRMSPMQFTIKVCKEKFGISDIKGEVDFFDALDVYFGVYDIILEKSKDKNNSFSMRAVPEKEKWGMPYVFEYIFKNKDKME